MQTKQTEKKEETKGGRPESERGRVRRMVLNPLAADGFRFRHGTPPEKQVDALARMADTLAYMTDHGLSALRVSLATKGDGSSRHFWPSFATVIGTAEAFEKRPLAELPELLRWFRSRAGRDALHGDRLLAEYRFWIAKKRPPVSDRDRKAVQDRAGEYHERAMRAQDRIDRGHQPLFDEGPWLREYHRMQAYCEGLVNGTAEAKQ